MTDSYPGSVVVAIGGNALSPSGEPATVGNQFGHTRQSLRSIVDLALEGWRIAVVHGNAGPAALSRRGIHYWALGGRHERSTPLSSPGTAHFPGSPQGRCPKEAGPHGCTLVEIDDARQAHLTFVPTDVMRWQNERVMVYERTTREELEGMLRERMQALTEAMSRTDLLVSWTVASDSGGGAESPSHSPRCRRLSR